VPTFFPPELVLPMVAPHDIGQVAARLMLEPTTRVGTHHVEGPERYSARDVAAAFAKALGRSVEAVETPPERWEQTFASLGFSQPAAKSFAAMTSATLTAKFPELSVVIRGTTSLPAYIEQLVA
jgi:uncharacterized protein YbjT (DUF2867 family)